ncbi:amidase signature domain-containing protein [Fusarium redolens]|uniref:Amidase signature domain-containing protein n=1 Tax=Fusarium redolens TaxID=48865 RepID=A0A9P9JSU5_FUSRE|nr:amidase signature domain-containing protein [Fusarium redolens]KAH7205445.1 amidase signature domain-containing protein [Fusarium redolens]
MAISIDGQITIPSVVGPMAASVSGLGLVTKALLKEEPWLYDPNVLELPWRASQYDAMAKIIADANVGHGRLAFGIIEHDGVVAPHPPVKRALRIVVNTLEKLGHQIIRWTPPSHELGVRLALTAWIYDGGVDVHHHMGLAHEPIPDVLARTYGTKPLLQFNTSEIHRNNVLLREWRKAYLDYWNSTSNLTGTGRPVDAVICPVAPFCAVRPTKYHYYGYSVWPNATDYTAGSFPVTLANKRVDTKDESYQPINDIDRKVYDDYDAEIYDKSPAGLQLVARRFEEEKMLALLEYVGELFKA